VTASERAVNAALVDVWRAQLVAARQLQPISQRALSERVGVTQQRLSEWESGTYTPTVANWQVWAGALGFDLQLIPTQPEGAR
jgi:transcriptional regulator with XRE-family HTH domain